MSDPPKRYESGEMTIPIPRESLPPASTIPVTIEHFADLERARRDAEDDIDTLVPCPACSKCPGCSGGHMVSLERASFLRSLEEPKP